MRQLEILIQVATAGSATHDAGIVFAAAYATHSLGLAWLSHTCTLKTKMPRAVSGLRFVHRYLAEG